jgi:hypothetical protein
MVLSNAERQRRYLARLKARAAMSEIKISNRDPSKMTMEERSAEIQVLAPLLEAHPLKKRIDALLEQGMKEISDTYKRATAEQEAFLARVAVALAGRKWTVEKMTKASGVRLGMNSEGKVYLNGAQGRAMLNNEEYAAIFKALPELRHAPRRRK